MIFCSQCNEVDNHINKQKHRERQTLTLPSHLLELQLYHHLKQQIYCKSQY